MIRLVWLMTILSALGCAPPPEAVTTGSLEARFGEAAEAVLDHAVRIETSELSITLRAEDREERLVFDGGAERGVTLRLRGGLSLQIIEDDASGVVRRERGALTHARLGGASYWTLAEDGGLEEWLALDEAHGDRPVATWRVAGHTLRELPERGVHVLRDGAPVAFVSAPRAVNDRGERVPTWLRVEGDRLALYVDGGGAAVLADPLWVATGSLALGRSDTAVELVPGGAVILGGYLSSPVATQASVERYDALTGVWSSAGTLLAGRGIHSTARLLSGQILLAGGDGAAGSPVASAERYDPVTETSSAAGSMAAARVQHTMTVLPSGRVLVAGGSATGIVASAEIYDPSTNGWTPTGSMTVPRTVHTATLLPSGNVLVIGGTTTPSTARASAEIYDPATGTWSATGSMSTVRDGHSATLLPSGLVLIAGGRGGSYLASAELYDPSTGTFTPTGSMSEARNFHSATLLSSGRVLIAGGANGPSIASAEIYDPVSGTFRDAPPLGTARVGHGAVRLASGRVLVAAGGSGVMGELTLTELFDESPICGNGELESGEACDDGNTEGGDCCDAGCAFEASTTVCRAAVSPCDIAERCSGTEGTCPMDIIADSVTTCRAATCSEGEASPVTHCTGLSTVCPPPTVISCAPFECAELVCGECDDDTDCSGLRCVDHLCVDPGDAGTDAGGTDAGTDAGGTDAGGSDAGASDAGASDAGARDGGMADASIGADAGGVPVSGGCGCSVPRAPASRAPYAATLLAALIGLALRRR